MRGGITPVLRRDNQTTHNRVIVDIIDFLVHHLIRIDLLRVNAFLPYLMFLEFLVRSAEIGELIDQPVTLFQFDLGWERMRSETLEMAQGRWQIGAMEDGVKMVFHDDPGVDLELPVFPAMNQGVDENVAAGRRGENREPFNYRGGDEIGGVRLADAIAGSHEGRREYGMRGGKCVLQWLSDGVARTSAFPDGVWERGKVQTRPRKRTGRSWNQLYARAEDHVNSLVRSKKMTVPFPPRLLFLGYTFTNSLSTII